MAELADAHGSGPCDSNVMRVQVPFSALLENTLEDLRCIFCSDNEKSRHHACMGGCLASVKQAGSTGWILPGSDNEKSRSSGKWQ